MDEDAFGGETDPLVLGLPSEGMKEDWGLGWDLQLPALRVYKAGILDRPAVYTGMTTQAIYALLSLEEWNWVLWQGNISSSPGWKGRRIGQEERESFEDLF